jgi:hypothetical protein
MRWLYIDPTNRREAAYRAEKLAAMDAWWRAFRLKAGQIREHFSGKSDWDLAGWMGETLGAVDERLMWEFGPAVAGQGHRLVITPEAEHWLRPLVDTLLETAPPIPEWEFYAYRLPDPPETVVDNVRARTGGDVSQATVAAQLQGSGRIDLTFTLPNCRDSLDVDARTAAFVAAEELLGEELVDLWIGEIQVSPPKRRGLLSTLRRGGADGNSKSNLPLAELPLAVGRLVASLRSSLPARPCFEFIHDTPWSSFTFQPQERDDYDGRDDLLVAISGRSDVLQAAHSASLFHSRCFSRHGETFCYLKIDGVEGLEHSRFADRAEIEDALNEVLIPARAGCAIGGGTGLRYSYIDLALTSVSQARPLLREVLLSGGIPRRTWLLFFDATLAREWTGIHDDAPPPGVVSGEW